MSKFVSYLRVSTTKQDVDAQRGSVSHHVKHGTLLAEYAEVESGKRQDRPELEKALRHAKAANATLICAKLDRIGRKASHVLTLLDSASVPVVFADNPAACKLTLGVLAVVAEQEARAISERTKAGLAAAKARGVKLGNPNGAAALRRYEATHGHIAATEGRIKAADEFSESLRFAVDQIISDGHTTLQSIADALNHNGFPARRGGLWSKSQILFLLKRLDISPYRQAA